MIEYLSETHLEVHDLDASIAFYEKLGLRLGTRSESAAFCGLVNSPSCQTNRNNSGVASS